MAPKDPNRRPTGTPPDQSVRRKRAFLALGEQYRLANPRTFSMPSNFAEDIRASNGHMSNKEGKANISTTYNGNSSDGDLRIMPDNHGAMPQKEFIGSLPRKTTNAGSAALNNDTAGNATSSNAAGHDAFATRTSTFLNSFPLSPTIDATGHNTLVTRASSNSMNSFLLTRDPQQKRQGVYDPFFSTQSTVSNYNSNYTTAKRDPHFDAEIMRLEENMVNYHTAHQLEVIDFKQQVDKSESDMSSLKSTLSMDFGTLQEQLSGMFAEMEKIKSNQAVMRFEGAQMSEFAKGKMLAEAASQEAYAKGLRNTVAGASSPGERTLAQLALPSVPHNDDENDGVPQSSAGFATEPNTPKHKNTNVHFTEGVAENEAPEPDFLPQFIASLKPFKVEIGGCGTFTWEELHALLGGAQYSPGLVLTGEYSNSILKGRTYWILDSEYEPFVPKALGQHGAKLTAFFNETRTADDQAPDENDYTDVPVFINLAGSEGYTYMGQYSQTRYSDKVSHSELVAHVPSSVLEFWASQLADPQRPAWVTEALIAHFWPRPTYAGPIPSDSAVTTPGTAASNPRDPERPLEKKVAIALEKYAQELREWRKVAELKVCLLTKETLMEMWKRSDLDEEKGLRLWWEYMQCVGYDLKFYEKLVAAKDAQKDKGRQDLVFQTSSASATETPRGRDRRPVPVKVGAPTEEVNNDVIKSKPVHILVPKFKLRPGKKDSKATDSKATDSKIVDPKATGSKISDLEVPTTNSTSTWDDTLPGATTGSKPKFHRKTGGWVNAQPKFGK